MHSTTNRLANIILVFNINTLISSFICMMIDLIAYAGPAVILIYALVNKGEKCSFLKRIQNNLLAFYHYPFY